MFEPERRKSRAAGVALALLLGVVGIRAGHAAEPVVQAEDLRRGLVTTYRDGARPHPAEVVQLEPTVALALKAGEAPDPRLRADDGTVVWKGYLNVLRGGAYRFHVRLRGRLLLTVGGKEVLAGVVTTEKPVLREGAEVRLEAGVHPFVAEFTRLPGAARVELFWESPFFRREPLPFDVLGHLRTEGDARLAADALRERGRFLAEEANCMRCHRPADGDHLAEGLSNHLGPDLSQAGQRLHPGWVERWLDSPRKLRPGAVMPEMFSHDEAGLVERYAVARYLASLGGPVPSNPQRRPPREVQASADRGRRLFATTGCIACHGEEGGGQGTERRAKEGGDPDSNEPHAPLLYPPARTFPLSGMGSKTTPEKLAAYLKNPLAIDPSGRMPNMVLQDREAEDLARYLCRSKGRGLSTDLPPEPTGEQMLAAFRRVDGRAEELEAFKQLLAAERWTDLGKRLVIDKGCNNCHTIAPGGKPFAMMQASASLDDIRKTANQDRGCLAETKDRVGPVPAFAFDNQDRKALRAFLSGGLAGAGSPAPAYEARRKLVRFNCLACHGRDGEGGLTPALTEQLRRFEKAENAEAVVPPPLTGVGHKLRTPWARQVLLGAGRARPWMALRMPQFGEANVGRLPDPLAALEGAEPDETIHKVPLSAARIEAGRHLVGKGAFGCISCHDIAGIPNTGTRGPDLALMDQRVRYDWYLGWLEQPQRIQPGTRMPSVFMDGKSLVDSVLGGKADAQAEAMWGYLSLGASLPLPEGLEPRKGLVVPVQKRPVLLRTFMPDAGPRALAVGFPGGVSVAFDAHACRLAYAWSGEFLDASPVWADRGGSPARVLGARFWNAPAGCPVATTSSAGPPDFDGRTRDPAYGGAVPEGKVYEGPPRLQFDGYTVDGKGVPAFHYHLRPREQDRVEVSERIEPLNSPVGVGVFRRFCLDVPAGRTTWLRVGDAVREPRLLDARGETVVFDLRAGQGGLPASTRLLVLPQNGDRVVVLSLAGAPPGCTWRVEKARSGWQALLRVPPRTETGPMKLDLKVWSPYRDEPGLLKELLTRKEGR
jgi:mono/diheme cytochrome c family protein